MAFCEACPCRTWSHRALPAGSRQPTAKAACFVLAQVQAVQAPGGTCVHVRLMLQSVQVCQATGSCLDPKALRGHIWLP